MTTDMSDCFELSSDIVYFPVRHHSPACSFHIMKVIEEYSPDCILIEGPTDADFLIPYLADEGTKPPVCIYSSYDDRKGDISEEKEKYRAYYPFLEYSPEYVALKTACKRNIPAHFIDMPFGLTLTMFGQREQGGVAYDESAAYYRAAAEKSGCRCFSEFWERGFEQEISGDTKEFVKSVLMLGRYMRELSPSDERNDCREAYMRKNIAEYSKQYKKILVIAGAYHIYGLAYENKKVKMGKYSLSDSAAYLMPYSFAEADSRSGYGAGIPYPAFYSQVWKKLAAGSESPYLETAEEFIVSTARYARTKQPVSIPDETEALYMAKNLAALRGIPQPGAFELIDGVRSAFVKGDVTTAAAFELDYLLRRMTGMGAGEINLSGEGASEIIPPCVAGFRALCKKYRLNTGTIVQQSTQLDVVKNPAHYEKSCFLHRMDYLGTGFCRLEKGADHAREHDTALIREKWSYRYGTFVETKLIDLSVYGGSIESICRALLKNDFKNTKTAAAAGTFLLDMFASGFSVSGGMLSDILEIIRGDLDLASQCTFMGRANRLIRLRKDIARDGGEEIKELLKLSFDTAVCRIYCVRNADEGSADKVCSGLRLMYSLAEEYSGLLSKNELMEQISDAADNSRSSPMVYGTCLALCGRAGMISEEEYGGRISAYMMSAEGRDSAAFISGVVSSGRDIIFTGSSVLESIDAALRRMDNEKFQEVLPLYRRAFTAFLPSETNRIGKMVADLYGIGADAFAGSMIFTEEEIKRASALDGKAFEYLKKYGLYGGERVD